MGISARKPMQNQFITASLADTSGHPAKYRWGKDDMQPMQLPNPTAHIRVTKKLLPDFLSLGVDMLIDAGYVKPQEKEAVITQLQAIYIDRRETIATLLCDDSIISAKQKDAVLKRLRIAGECPTSDKIADALLKAELIQHQDISAVADKLKSLPKRPFIHLDSHDSALGGVNVLWRIKEEESAYTKMRKDGKSPEEIGDYFGLRFIPDTVAGTVALRSASLSHSMSSRKCELSAPSDEIFMSHKSHNTVSNEDNIQSAEVSIIPKALSDCESITHRLKEMEDNMKAWNEVRETEFSSSALDPKVRGKVAVCAEELRQVRIFINGTAAVQSGLIEMADPKEKERALKSLVLARQTVNNVSPYTEKMLDRVDGIQGYLGTVRAASRIAHTSANAWDINMPA